MRTGVNGLPMKALPKSGGCCGTWATCRGGEGTSIKHLGPIPNSVPSSLYVRDDFTFGQPEAQQLVRPFVSFPTRGDHLPGAHRYSNLKEDPATGVSLGILVIMEGAEPRRPVRGWIQGLG